MSRWAPLPTHPCGACGTTLTARVKGDLCKPCIRQRAAEAEVCPSCGGHKERQAGVCVGCYQSHAPLADATSWSYVLWTFDATRFRALLEHAGWTVVTLAEVSGVSRVTLWDWLAGTGKPSRVQYEKVARVLCLEPCAHCGGAGQIDPTEHRVLAVVQQVTAAHRQPTPIAPPCDVRVDHEQRLLRINGLIVLLSPSETAAAALLLDRRGDLVTSDDIQQAAGCSSTAGARFVVAGIRRRVKDAGANPDTIAVTYHGRGYSMPADGQHRERSA